MTRVLHVIVGPAEHGVVRHGELIARACGDDLLRVPSVDDLTTLPPCDVVHVPFTDRLFAPTLDETAVVFERLRTLVAAHGAALSVTLHDVPAEATALQQRRLGLYRAVMAAARGVVVNSATELGLVENDAENLHSLRMIPLPIEQLPAPEHPVSLPPRTVAVLGFVFPDRGYDDVIAALPDDSTLVAIGRPSAGHEDLPDRYAALAGNRWRITGFVPDGELRGYLDAVAVPVAPNRRVTASGSINTWVACGRRPLVPDSPYARELDAARPGTVRLYDASDPLALRSAIDDALADPTLTEVAAGSGSGPSVGSVALQYREHLAACVPPLAHVIGGRVVVPRDRFDLVPRRTATDLPLVSVVVPYYDAQHQLDLVLSALSVQTYPRELIEVIVADDGSPVAPDLSAARTLPVRTVRQDDDGFRAARVRNLGARSATGSVLAFLDGDTVPEPGYLAALVDLPARCPDVVSVGRRRHADLASIDAARVRAWATTGVEVSELAEPAWLRDAYTGTGNLLRAGRRSYRYVLSAVLAIDAKLFGRIGGFDERFTGYGGEDWELAHRARTAGAVLAHVPEAVAWHDGPDWAGRGDAAGRTRAKNHETATLAALLPDPQSRGAGQWAYPSIVVHAGTMGDVDALATVRTAVAAGVDCAFWFDEITGVQAGLVTGSPGVHLGAPPVDVTARAWCQVWLCAPTDLGDLTRLADLAERHGEVVTPAVRLRATRAVERVANLAVSDRSALSALLFGRQDRTSPAPFDRLDLAATLAGAGTQHAVR